MNTITINKKEFKVVENEYGEVIEVGYNFLKKLNLSQIPENICIHTQKGESGADFIIQKINDKTVEIELRECIRRKYWMEELGVAPYMKIKKKIIEQMTKEGFDFNITTFETDDEDDYNNFEFTIKFQEDKMEEVFKKTEDALCILESKVDAVVEDINKHIRNVIGLL